PPNRRRPARAPSVKAVRGVGYPYPSCGARKRCRAPMSLIFADLKPPEASARTLGEGCGRGGVPPTP
ncbi:hypothetical protein EV121DRAFT_177567, partial [Schizophyllum commune]